MKRPKKNPDLSEALSHLRDWARIERKLTDDPAAHKVWRDVEDWTAGVALKYRAELAPTVSPSNAGAVARQPGANPDETNQL